MRELHGSLVAIVTPFRNGDLDLDTFGALVEWHIEQGTNGIVVAGTTGEAATLHAEEREQLSRRAVEIAAGRVHVMVGTGTNCTRTSVELTRAATQWGVDSVLAVTPYYNKPTQEGLVQHYAAMAEVGLPVVAYDVPGRTGVTIAEETVHRIAGIENIVALKDATLDLERAARLAKETGLVMLSGDDAATLAMMRDGAKGVVSVAANVAPQAMAKLCADLDEEIHNKLSPLFQALFVQTNPLPVKWALARMGRIANELRLPLVPMDAAYESDVEQALAQAGLL
ncbi:MAG: 4-hydroxy-tetrahydrodipicolinate synthase [Planctomycetota bacterium]